jgi:hypothetical protein
MAIPGFRRGTRWRSATAAAGSDGSTGMFVLYELESHDTLASPAYLARLNAPSPWSTRLMPHHARMVRSQTVVVASRGGVPAAHAMTVRLGSAPARQDELQIHLASLADRAPKQPGLVGLHVLRHRAPAIAVTTEQTIRGGADGVADWIVVACGYDADALHAWAEVDLSPERLAEHGAGPGAGPGAVTGLYGLAYSATPGDVAAG